ncbi:hypothetical protein C1A50_2627 [Paenibacillus polymyxa]|nr:hypothetical protein C1A50_2627 [Paenibacillus polymyxa]
MEVSQYRGYGSLHNVNPNKLGIADLTKGKKNESILSWTFVVKIETHGTIILIDPFITGNSNTDLEAANVQADVILLTHGHGDHVGNTVKLQNEVGSLLTKKSKRALSFVGRHPFLFFWDFNG